jgi:hypothetical protein
MRVKYRSIKAIEWTYQYYTRGWKCCPCTWTHSLYRLNMFKFTSWIKCGFNYFEMPVSCARHLSYFCGVYSNLAPSSSIFFFSKHTTFSSRFLVQMWPSEPDFLNKFTGGPFRWNCVPEKFTTLSSGATFHIRFVQNARCWPVYWTISTHTTITSI